MVDGQQHGIYGGMIVMVTVRYLLASICHVFGKKLFVALFHLWLGNFIK